MKAITKYITENTVSLIIDAVWLFIVVATMGVIYNQAYKSQYNLGYEFGYDQGYDEGYDEGWEYGAFQVEMGFCTTLGASDWKECKGYIDALDTLEI